MLAFLRRSLAVALLWAALAGIAPAASPEFVAGVQSELFAGRTEAAAALAETELGRNPADDQARFALGATQFLQAVERLGQGLHRYGLASTAGEGFAGLGVLPILRLPVPPNPNPENLTYESFNALLDGFVADLGRAEATLAGIGATPLHLPLDLALIRLDLDGDGRGSEDESLTRIFAAPPSPIWKTGSSRIATLGCGSSASSGAISSVMRSGSTETRAERSGDSKTQRRLAIAAF